MSELTDKLEAIIIERCTPGILKAIAAFAETDRKYMEYRRRRDAELKQEAMLKSMHTDAK
jgi:hypothetical protein